MIPRLWDLGPVVAAGRASRKRENSLPVFLIDPNLPFKALRACYTFQALLGRVNTTNPLPHPHLPSWAHLVNPDLVSLT